MTILQVVLRIMHLSAAIIAGGAIVFQRFALLPALRSVEEGPRTQVRAVILRRWRGVVWTCIGFLLLSGLLTFLFFKLPEYHGKAYAGLYHGLFGLKLLAALALFHAVTILVMPGEHFEKYRARAGFWLSYAVALLAVIVIVAGVMRYLPTFYA